MMGCSPYETRSALLCRKATGLVPDVDAATQRRFDDGHRAEAAMRPVAEAMIGEELFPATITTEVDGIKLLASMDGLTMLGDIGWENKLRNADTIAHIEQTGEPPLHHVWQLEQQLLVSGADRILFTCGDGTEPPAHCWYESKPERRAQLIAGWKQFAADLAAYVPEAPAAPAPAGRAPESLPALRIEVTGAVTASNLADFKAHALAVFKGINRNLRTDQDFADAERTIKWCSDVEARLKAAKEAALAQTADIEALFRAIDDIAAEARSTRLDLDKLVKARKEQIKAEIVAAGQAEFKAHLRKLQDRIGMPLPTGVLATDFAGAIKGLRSLESLKDAVHQAVTSAKLAANEIADRMEINAKSLRGEAHDWSFLFPDLASVADKPAEDFANLLAARIAAWNAREEQRRQREAAQAQQAKVVQQAIDAAASKVGAEALAKSVDTMKLGEINALIAPLSISADGLASIGFEPVGKEGAAKLYRASDLPAICAALIDVLRIAAGEGARA
jgi:predicted phage-related endonuclease